MTDAALEVLDVGAGRSATALGLFPGSTVTRLDVDPLTEPAVCHDITLPLPIDLRGTFDVVVASHVLEHLVRQDVVPALKNLAEALRPGGVIYVITPSLEWCAKELLKDHPSPTVLACLYGEGSEEQQHRCGFTLAMLRQVLGMAGLHTRQAHNVPFTVTIGGKDHEAVQNVVVAFKPKEIEA